MQIFQLIISFSATLPLLGLILLRFVIPQSIWYLALVSANYSVSLGLRTIEYTYYLDYAQCGAKQKNLARAKTKEYATVKGIYN